MTNSGHIGDTKGEFSVYWYEKADKEEYNIDKRFVGPQEAIDAARRLTLGPLAQTGMVEKVLITDGLDECNFHWEKGRIVFPTREQVDDMLTNREASKKV